MSEGSWYLKQRHQSVFMSPEPPTFALQKVWLQAFPSEHCSPPPLDGLKFIHSSESNTKKHNDELVMACHSKHTPQKLACVYKEWVEKLTFIRCFIPL